MQEHHNDDALIPYGIWKLDKWWMKIMYVHGVIWTILLLLTFIKGFLDRV